MKTLLSILTLIIIMSTTALAQRVPPALIVDVNQGRGVKKYRPLAVSKLDVNVKIIGFLAETKMTMTFYNPNNRAYAGDLYFPLPEGATVSGYALDINGIMVDGVVVEKHQGRQVFEKIVRRGIDPGLVEWSKGNNFKTRVFPIPARGTRTVSVSYVADLLDQNDQFYYHLPLNFKEQIKQFSIRVEVVKSYTKPKVTQGDISNFQFEQWRDSYVAETKLTNQSFTKELIISIPQLPQKKGIVQKGSDGFYYFVINDLPQKPDLSDRKNPSKLTIFWDASGSRANTHHDKEFQLLQQYFSKINQTVDVQLILFRNVAGKKENFKIVNGDCDALIRRLKQVQYDGGTQMASVTQEIDNGESDIFFLFSDGLSNFGHEKPSLIKKPIYVFANDQSVNYSLLKYLAMKSGGEFFNLTRLSISSALNSLVKQSYSYLSSSYLNQDAGDIYPAIPQTIHNRFTLVGKLYTESATIKINYGIPGETNNPVQFTVSRSDAVSGDLLRRYWAQKKIDDLMIFQKKNEKEIQETGKKYSIVTTGTSLIVLENLDQYVEFKIAPPKSLPEMRLKYEQIIAQQMKNEQEKKEDKIQYILQLWKSRVDWWNTEFKYPDNFQYTTPSPKKMNRPQANGSVEEDSRDRTTTGSPSTAIRAEQPLEGERRLAAKKDEKKVSKPQRSSTIEVKPHDPKSPYINELKQARTGELFSVYMQQKKKYGTSPGFYLDCTDYFLKLNEKDLALQILSNIAELELENPALLRILGHRLGQLKHFELSVLVFKEVLKMRPEEPQSYRDLALVLGKQADKMRIMFPKISSTLTREGMMNKIQSNYKQGIELLNHVVMNKWDRFAEVELIALMEANNMIARAKTVEMQSFPIDSRLIQLLDVDLRIVLTWDMDLTDMDLWVTEPSNEKAYYGHRRTTIGGNVSRDFTRGYGPEEYMVKKAMNGDYHVAVKYYGSSSASFIGGVTVQVDVFTNYGRPNEKHLSVTRRLKDVKGMIDIFKVNFKQ